MPILPPAMVCQTKIVADEEMPGPKSDPIVSSSQMWPPPPAAQPPAGTSSPAAPLEAAAAGDQRRKRDAVFIREFEHSDRESVRRIFYEGIMERIPNTAFRGLKQQPRIILLYLSLTGSCFWVAILDGNVVGIVAARGNEEDNTVELCRMSVDFDQRGKGIAKALGRKVLEFAVLNNYSAVVLGTTAVKMAAHKLYESLGFRRVGVTDHYVLPGMTLSALEKVFFQVRYHRYRLHLREE
ncbi:N-acetylaspartate synthetase isoform X3 [Leucoraja erinacea]|uniref:N-acetylaspartate synthetase isoform X3 n=1 Tax=Leucoraja erinaceus TaxID=7782 RepID=UPI0024576B6C|nr:N-acetylaspartate synthetase isoform X3 [Leucoraja erinacea]